MNIEKFREYCLSFPGTTEGLPFDETTLVFYVKGKMFTLTDIDAFEYINLKCNPEIAVRLREEHESVIPGYHMNKKHWNSVRMDGKIPDTTLEEWIRESYRLVVATLPKKTQRELQDQ